jgi:hypothetical protein
MRKTLIIASFALLLIFAQVTFLPAIGSTTTGPGGGSTSTSPLQTPSTLEIYGAVRSPLNLTYAELASMPMVSEVAELLCVTGSPDVTYNWTGVPLFYLLTLAQIEPDAYKIVTICSDGYTSDLLVEDALQPTTILALEANGTSLPQLLYGPEGPNRLVVPGKWGYKWSSGIEEIEVVTTNYLGEYESSGYYSDTADIPNYGPMPTPTPAPQTLDIPYGNRTLEVGAFTNASITAYSFDASRKAFNVNVTVPEGTSGFADFILQQNFLSRPYNFTLDGETVSAIEADTNASSYIYLALTEGFHTVSIIGAEFHNVPVAVVSYLATVGVGQNVTFDASKSVDVGYIVSYEWSFGDGTNGTGPVVLHAYSKKGVYQVELNETDNYGLSSSETFTITVGSGSLNVLLAMKALLAAVLVLLILMFAVLVWRRRKERVPKQ